MQKYFEEKTVLITGGSSGIGYALAERIASYKPQTIVLISHEQKKLKFSVDQLEKTAPNIPIRSYVIDIADSKAVKQGCAQIVSDLGAPDILINNAGYAHYLLFHEMSEDEIVHHVNVNLIGAMRVTHAFLPAMRKAKCGQIVNITSIAGHMVMTPNLVYSAAKHALLAWSEGLSIELKSDGISVQSISPGRVLTDFFRHESFQARTAGSETRLIVAMNKVIDASINAIVKRRLLTVVPKYWSLIVWLIQTCPHLMKPLYHYLLKKRVNKLKLIT